MLIIQFIRYNFIKFGYRMYVYYFVIVYNKGNHAETPEVPDAELGGDQGYLQFCWHAYTSVPIG